MFDYHSRDVRDVAVINGSSVSTTLSTIQNAVYNIQVTNLNNRIETQHFQLQFIKEKRNTSAAMLHDRFTNRLKFFA